LYNGWEYAANLFMKSRVGCPVAVDLAEGSVSTVCPVGGPCFEGSHGLAI